MTQKSNIYDTREFNKLINSLIRNKSVKVQEIVLPPSSIAQNNPINITTSKDVNFQGIPLNIQLHLQPEGYVSNWNSCLTFEMPIEIDFSKLPGMTIDYVNNLTTRPRCDIVLLDNFLCLKVSIQVGADSQHYNKATQYVRIMQIPPSPAAWLSDTLLQKNNKGNSPLNSYSFDIFRKQCVNNQLIDNDFTQYKQDQYAMVNQGHTTVYDNQNGNYAEDIIEQAETANKETLLASYYLDLNEHPVITYKHTVEIPLCYFHPFFQLSGSSPLQLLNDELLLTFNFNREIFSAVYAYDRYKPFTFVNSNNVNQIPQIQMVSGADTWPLSEDLDVRFTGINNIKLILYKDRVYKEKQMDEFKKMYITFRNSDKVQQKDFTKNSTCILQSIISKLNSLDIIQLSVYDPVLYTQNGDEQNLDYFLGYSSLYNTSYYTNFKSFNLYQDVDSGYQTKLNLYNLQDVDIQDQALCLDFPFITFAQVQLQIDGNSIIPYTYQSYQNIYQGNMAIYDINDNKAGVNNQWSRNNWTRYFNCWLYKFDQSIGSQDELRSASFQGLKTTGSNSSIYFELYNYNQPEPMRINYDTGEGGIYNNWISNKAFVEFIYYYTSLMMISNDGDLILVNEDTAEKIMEEFKQEKGIVQKAEAVETIVKESQKVEEEIPPLK